MHMCEKVRERMTGDKRRKQRTGGERCRRFAVAITLTGGCEAEGKYAVGAVV